MTLKKQSIRSNQIITVEGEIIPKEELIGEVRVGVKSKKIALGKCLNKVVLLKLRVLSIR